MSRFSADPSRDQAANSARRALRLDAALVERGLSPSRDKAKRAIMAGKVTVDGARVDKAGTPVAVDSQLEILAPKEPYVSRAGRKLAGALDQLGVDPTGMVCLDVGASTGGFTDCLLKRGAVRVYALDVGRGQLDHRLRTDPRVVVMERVNARYLGSDDLDRACDLITIDVSFISLSKIVPALMPHLVVGGRLLALIKPQFEAGRGQVGKGGVIRDPRVRQRAIDDTVSAVTRGGLECLAVIDSEVPGVRGNREAFGLFALAEGDSP